ncbi:MAG: WGR domain-containing protein [Myxococcota bacterium]|nr:WGR domain-containing protein [Myxococcota bacterium]
MLVDNQCPLSKTAAIHSDYNATLNQTNIHSNNNKFYIIQLIVSGEKHYVWNHWGRVGEGGQSSLKGPYPLTQAISVFEKKFKSKTSNHWSKRTSFVPRAGKYQLIEVEGEADADTQHKLEDLDRARPKVKSAPSKYIPSALPGPLQDFMKLIFSKNMFVGAMSEFDIDTKKMPLGKLSKKQVQRGYDMLVEIQAALDSSLSQRQLARLSSHFYTVIPHAFGRRAPPLIDTTEKLGIKLDMLNVLSDIELALAIHEAAQQSAVHQQLANPIDKNYDTLQCSLEPVDKRSDEYAMIETYLKRTRRSSSQNIVDIFRANRGGSAARFDAHKAIDNRKLLWHGTNIAVIAAILSSGLRIMPHSGGRVGKGIYLASEQSKSAGYTSRSNGNGVMFLCEAALGREHHISRDNARLKRAPRGYDSIVARGRVEPDPSKDIRYTIDGRDVVVPNGKPIKQSGFSKSSFSQSEYLLYKESQVRIRYVLRMRM